MNQRLWKRAAWYSRALVVAVPLVALAACSSPEQRAEAHYQSGNELVAKGEFVRAGLEFRNAIKYNEKLAAAWEGLALVEEKAGNIAGAMGALNRTLELDAKNVNAHVKLGTFLLAAQQTDQALIHANAANDLKKDDTAVLALRAAVLFRLNDREGAKADAEKALALNPDNADAHGVLAALAMADGNNKEAMQFIDRGLQGDPKNLGLMLFKARLYEMDKDDVKLEASLRQIAETFPDVLELRKPLLAFLLSRKRVDEAEAEIRKLAAAKPDDPETALGLVGFIVDNRGMEAGRAELDRLMKEHPDVVTYKLAAARMDFNAGKLDAAKATVEQVIAKGEPAEDVAKARVLLASMLIDSKDEKAASTVVDALLAADAKNAEGLSLRATLKLARGDTDGAIADAREALNQTPQSVPLMLILARSYERMGSIDLAVDRYAEAAKQSNYSPQVTIEYVNFLVARDKTAPAVSVLSDALAANPDNVQLLSTLGRVKLGLGEAEEAQKIAEKIKSLGDTSGAGQAILSDALMRQKKYGEVISSLQGTTGAEALPVRPLANVVQAYVQSGKTDEAETFLNAAITANPKNAEAQVLLGGVKAYLKKPAEAEALYRKAIESQPSNAIGYRALAGHYLSAGQADQAEATLKDALTKIPGDGTLSLSLAGLMERSNRMEDAIKIYEAQFAATPDAGVIINNLASLLADYRTDQASFDRAYQISRRLESIAIPQYKDTLGWIAYRRGEYDRAADLLKAVVKDLPNEPIARYHLGMTLVALKRNEDAKSEFDAARKLLKDGDPLVTKIDAEVAKITNTP